MKLSLLSRRLRSTLAALFILSALGRSALRAADASADSVEKLDAVTVSSTPAPDNYQLPQTVQTVNAAQMNDTVNVVDVEDAIKYLPSLFLRKRDDGDTQAVLATRTWGINSSARSLVYADGVLLSALIANNNTIGAPRWGMVAPEEIEHIDVLDGPFAAAYPGNSMGAVVEITTRMPDKLEATVTQTEAFQDFSQYSTKNTYTLNQTAVTAGNRMGKWSIWVSGNDEDSHTQPLLFVTAATLPAGTTGGIIAFNKLGQPADVLGASGILDADFVNAKVKVAYDLSSTVRATYTLGVWTNHTDSAVQTYLRDASGQPTYAGVAGFATGYYNLVEEHTMHSLAVKSSGQGDWDWQAVGSLYDFDKDTQKSPSATAAATGIGLSTVGKVALYGGTGWDTIDLKAAWHPEGRTGPQELSFGVHDDEYSLVNPTYNTPNWQSGQTFSSLSTEGNGKTETKAAWVQDAWQFTPALKLTIGGRYEDWQAFDGVNVSGTTTVIQPKESSSDFSPKATLAWTVAPDWTLTALVGNAYRFPTAGELYQLVSTGTTFTSPNPNLAPEKVWSEEVRAEYKMTNGSVRLSLFEEDTRNALVSQYNSLVPGASTQYQYIMNVGKIRNRGAELSADRNNVLIPGLELSGSVTYVDSRILEDTGLGQLAGTVGKKAPYVPMWRASFVATYRPHQDLAITVGGRYSGQQYSTVDNIDTNPNVFGGFDEFFVLDTHLNWNVYRHWALAGGVDNVLNRKYFLYHPFPQRTVEAELKWVF
jgi:iron complex outermembrane receptor protein